jgi:two-component system sensor histidine kinase/response regulator
VNECGPTVKHQAQKPVLVVDDDDINLLVATEELELQGYSFETATNGQEAVDLVKFGDFRLVFMDCQMPVMDGFAAAREIRAWEAPLGTRLPIVALTGHDDDREREKARAAGMDDFLAKPLGAADLRSVMDLFPGGRRAMPWPPEPPELTAGVRRSRRLIELFLNHVPQQLELLRAARLAEDCHEICNQAHKLKGTCLAVAADPMAQVADRLRHQTQAGELAGADSLLQELETRFGKVEALIRWELKAASTDSVPPYR